MRLRSGIAVALIRPLAWEPLYAAGVALKKQKKKKKKRRRRKKQTKQQQQQQNQNKIETLRKEFNLGKMA